MLFMKTKSIYKKNGLIQKVWFKPHYIEKLNACLNQIRLVGGYKTKKEKTSWQIKTLINGIITLSKPWAYSLYGKTMFKEFNKEHCYWQTNEQNAWNKKSLRIHETN